MRSSVLPVLTQASVPAAEPPTDTDSGLSSEEVQLRRRAYGPNEVP